MHDLRQLLRHAAVRKLAHDRPRDFAGLESGWSDQPIVRALQTTTMRCPCGPAILCVGQWTPALLTIAGRLASARCFRCRAAVEDLHHRLWTCPANLHRRLALDVVIGRNDLPRGLPVCLA